MENLLVFDDTFSGETVAAFRENFAAIWETGRAEEYYDHLLAYIASGSRYVPVLYPAMALTYNEVRELKQTIEAACPAVKEDFFKDYRQYFATFIRGLQLTYDEKQRVVAVQDADGQSFIANYTYNDQDAVTAFSFESLDNLQFQANYSYDEDGNLTGLLSPGFNMNFTYDADNQLTALNTSQGTHTWITESDESGFLGKYSTPFYSNYFTVRMNQQQAPLLATDADGRTIQWQYDEDNNFTSISSPDRTINYLLNNQNRDWLISSNDNESIRYQQPGINKYDITISGTVQANLHYTVTKKLDKKL